MESLVKQQSLIRRHHSLPVFTLFENSSSKQFQLGNRIWTEILFAQNDDRYREPPMEKFTTYVYDGIVSSQHVRTHYGQVDHNVRQTRVTHRVSRPPSLPIFYTSIDLCSLYLHTYISI